MGALRVASKYLYLGLKGHVRIVIPGYTSCIECDLSLFSREEVYPLCTITNTPRRIEHCLELARTSVWDSHNPFRSNLDIKNENHFQWIYEQSVKIAQNHKIDLVSQEKALNIIKNIIPAVISTNSTIAAICVSECFKIITSHSESMSGFLMLNLSDGKNCPVCSKKAIGIQFENKLSIQKEIDNLAAHFARIFVNKYSWI
ncbi:hypothetical protein HZS_6276 [Henneguya salminicola]|nr:hypothetical protein HZS_6276 [Henneguya salminicola]